MSTISLQLLLILIGLTGINSITTVNKVSVKAGSSVIIPCLYDKQHINHVKALCKGYDWNHCSIVVKTNQRNSGKFSISDDKSQRIFTVTIKDLTTEDTDYWCAVEIDGGPDVRAYFHLSVTTGEPSLYVAQQAITGFIGGDITIYCHYRNSGEIKWCRLGGSCVTMTSGSFYGARVTIIRRILDVFTVTMSGLSTNSSGWYLCVSRDLQMPVHLTVGGRRVMTVNKVSVKAGSSVIIPCLYDKQYINHVKALCKGYRWSSCSYKVKTNQRNSGKFSISDDKSQNIFTVTIKDLTTEDTDYWCAVEIDGGPDVRAYFHLSVTTGEPSLYVAQQAITGFIGGDITIYCHYRNSGEIKWCRLGGSCVTMTSGSFYGARVTIIRRILDVFTVIMSGLSTNSSGWYLCVSGDLQMPVHLTVDEQPTTTVFADTPPTTVQHKESPPDHLKIFSIRLAVLIFVVMVTSFTLFMFNRHRLSKEESSATTTVKYEAEEEATYSNAEFLRKTSSEEMPSKIDSQKELDLEHDQNRVAEVW